MFSFEDLFIHFIVNNDNYRGVIFPLLKRDYFKNNSIEQIVYDEIKYLISKNIMTINYIQLWLGINERIEDNDIKKKIAEKFEYLEDNGSKIENDVPLDIMLKKTEQYIQTKALHNAIFTAATILDKNDHDKIQSLPNLFTEALSIHIDNKIGTDVSNSIIERYWRRRQQENRIPFLIKKLNQITKNGFPRKTLNCFILPTGGGKSAILCSLAADYLRQGYNVLYVTLELSEDIISTRIDANITNTCIDELEKIELNEYLRRCEKGYTGKGRIIVREYPTSSVTTTAIIGLLADLKQKQQFVPDVLIVDYINIINPARSEKHFNSYSIVKATAEELRGICVMNNLVGITATQVNREGIKNNEVELTDTSDSIGLPFTLDFMCGGFQTETQRENNLVFMKVTKNRYSGYVNTKFILSLDFNLMKLSDISEQEEQLVEKNGSQAVANNRINRPLR